LRRRRINVEATDKISITPDILNTTVEPDFIVEQLSLKMPPPKTSDKNLDFESTLQAVILADSFNERFRIITLDRPRVVKEACPFHRTSESTIFVLDGKTNECVHCETVELYPRKHRMIMDMEVFKKHADVQIRNDLIDCQIDIRSVELYSPRIFDYQDIRKDLFMKNVIRVTRRLNNGSTGHHLDAQLWVSTVGANPNIGIYHRIVNKLQVGQMSDGQ
ncbi:1464_t:CDS:2, partial [Cetraspora pellucida]